MRVVPKWLRVFIPTVLIVVWMAAGALGGPYFGRVEEVSEVDLSAFLPQSSESAKVNEELKRFRDQDTFPAVVVFESTEGDVTDEKINELNTATEKLADVDGVVGEVSPAVKSEDNKAAFYVVNLDTEADQGEALDTIRESLVSSNVDDVRYKITGPAGFAADLNTAFSGIDGILLLTALAVVFVILIVVYRSVLLPVVVLLTSILALSASIWIVWWLAKNGWVELNGQVQGILFILVIGAATDYSLLYVARYREALYEHKDKFDATVAAYRGSLEPIIASGGTVIVGLLCLLLSDLASNKALGPVGSLGIAMAMLATLTFLPAVLYVFGRASYWPVHPLATKASLRAHKAKLERGFWHRIGMFVDRYPRRIWVATTIVLAVAALFATQIRAEGVAQSDLVLGTSEARDGQALLNKHFPGGSGSPAQVLVSKEKVDEVVTKLDQSTDVDSVSAYAENVESNIKPLGEYEKEIKDDIRSEVQKEVDRQTAELEASLTEIEMVAGPMAAEQVRTQALANIPSVDELVDEAYPFKDAVVKEVDDQVLLQVTLTAAPDSDEAKAAIGRMRDSIKPVDSTAMVGGNTAAQLDSNIFSIRDRTIIIPVVLGAITLILMLLLRSIVAPVLLLLSTVISFAASLGVAAILFNDILHLPGADPSVVLYAFVFLVALGIDYNIFLMSRVREEVAKSGNAKGVIKGLVVTGGVITSAGVVLASTFAALSVIPILFLLQLAFIVAFGVLLDTFIVRSLLVPALIKDMGPVVWWPSKLRHKP